MNDDPMNGGAARDELFATIRAALHDGDPLGVTDPDRGWPDVWCERCGGDDGDDELVLMVAPSGGIVRVHQVCGELCRATLIRPCVGPPDSCGARAGQPCAPGCPGMADDPPVPDPGPTGR